MKNRLTGKSSNPMVNIGMPITTNTGATWKTAMWRRQRGGTWKKVSDFHKYQEMPQAIRRDFDRGIGVYVEPSELINIYRDLFINSSFLRNTCYAKSHFLRTQWLRGLKY